MHKARRIQLNIGDSLNGLERAECYSRRFGFLTAATGFSIFSMPAKYFGADVGFTGLSDGTVRSMMHVLGYGMSALLLAKASNNWYLLAWLISVVLATVEEISQLIVPYRYASVSDWMMDLAGITCFLVVAKLLNVRTLALGTLLQAVWPHAYKNGIIVVGRISKSVQGATRFGSRDSRP